MQQCGVLQRGGPEVDELTRLIPDLSQIVRVSIRLLAAVSIGTAIGLQRELTHKPAGLRTHMLVALGTSLFVVAALESGMHPDSLSRIIQGLATGIGFLGAGAIMKLNNEREIHGLTTAAGVWMTAAASAAAALGQVAVAIIGTVFGLLILIAFRNLERVLGNLAKKDAEVHSRVNPNPKDMA
jgi:putative Mg2+ transporter-C (MgtC) family protein